MATYKPYRKTDSAGTLEEIKIPYSSIDGTPTIPTVNNGTLTIQKNGTNVATFGANQSANATANITVPTKVSQLTNDSGYTANKGTVTQVKINGTTKSPNAAGLVDLGTISGGGGSSNVTVDSINIQGVDYTVFDTDEYGSFIGTFDLETQDSAITITVGNTDYIITDNDWLQCKITIDKNPEFVYSTIEINTGNVNRTSFFSTLPSRGIVKISTNLSSSYMERGRGVIIKG